MKKIIIICLALMLTAPLFAQQFDATKVDTIKINSGCQDVFVKGVKNVKTDKIVVSFEGFNEEFETKKVGITGKVLKISIKKKRKDWFSRNMNFKCETKVYVSTPTDKILKVDLGSGEIIIKNMKADIDASSGSGEIEVFGAGQNLTLKTGSGEIELEIAQAKENCNYKLSTGSGEIEASFKKELVNCEVKARTGSGEIEIDLHKGLGNSKYNASTGSGDITFTVPKKTTYGESENLKTTTGSGKVKVETF